MPKRADTEPPSDPRIAADARTPVRRVPTAALALTLLFVLSTACAPTVEETSVVDTPTGPVAYVPTSTGAAWSYLPDRAKLDEPRVVVRIEGPTVLAGEVRTAWRMIGRGLDVTWFREHREDGTYLVREERPGAQITFDPPIREWTAGPFRVGQTWSGSTTATVVFPDAAPENRRTSLTLDYVTTVVDRRTVTVAAGTFEVFVLDFTSRTFDEDGVVLEELNQQTWFTPHLGEVRTDNELFLVDSNLIGLPRVP